MGSSNSKKANFFQDSEASTAIRKILRLEDSNLARFSGGAGAGQSDVLQFPREIQSEVDKIRKFTAAYEEFFNEFLTAYASYAEQQRAYAVPEAAGSSPAWPTNREVNAAFTTVQRVAATLAKDMIEGTIFGIVMATVRSIKEYADTRAAGTFDAETLNEQIRETIGAAQKAAGEKVWDWYLTENSRPRSEWAHDFERELGRDFILFREAEGCWASSVADDAGGIASLICDVVVLAEEIKPKLGLEPTESADVVQCAR